MATKTLPLACHDCGNTFGFAFIPDKEQLAELVPDKLRKLLIFLPDDFDLSGVTGLPLLCASCMTERKAKSTGASDGKERAHAGADSGDGANESGQ